MDFVGIISLKAFWGITSLIFAPSMQSVISGHFTGNQNKSMYIHSQFSLRKQNKKHLKYKCIRFARFFRTPDTSFEKGTITKAILRKTDVKW